MCHENEMNTYFKFNEQKKEQIITAKPWKQTTKQKWGENEKKSLK